MKKFTTFLFLIVLSVVTAFAAPVDPEKALEVANSFWKGVSGVKKSALRLTVNEGLSKSASRGRVSESDAQYYLFTAENNGGFVIVSGEDCLAPVVGYSTSICEGEMPPALVDWLAQYCDYVDDVRAGVIEPVETSAAKGSRIGPMLKTSWNQSAPYNNYCPEVNGNKTPTGCTATAMAQVMKFHEWPERPKKAITWHNNITDKTETIDITKNVYQWGNMLNHYRSGYTAEQADAVARLMIDVGKAIQSNYDPSGTGSSDIFAARGLVDVFDYSPQIKVVKRHECTYDEFISLIRENLEARQPLVHCGYGQSYAAGHAFVCDGIDENNMLHIDWGWDGAFNGFFDIGSMSPGGSGIGGGQDRYNVGQSLIVNIRPRVDGEAESSGVPTMYMYEVIDKSNDNAIVEEYTSKYSSGYANFRIMVQLLNWSHSVVDMDLGISISSVDGTFNKVEWHDTIFSLMKDYTIGFYCDFKINSTVPASKDYLKEGKYNVEIFYKNINGEPVKMPAENNRLILEVGKSSAKLSKALPDVEVAGFEFRQAPVFRNDKMVFDVAFKNKNTENATVLIVPITNRISNGTVVRRDTLASYGVLIDVLDNTNFLATYTINNGFSGSGDHYISFAYELRNSYINHDLSVDKSKLKSISGQSQTFTIQSLPDAPMPTVTSVTSNNPVFGNTLNLSVRILNNSEAAPCSTTLGVFAEKDGEKTLLYKGEIKDLPAGSSAVLGYSSANYVFTLSAGKYSVCVCEQKNGEWEEISHNKSYYFILQEPSKCLLYSNSRININNGGAVIQGDSIDVIADITCGYGNFDGYVRMNVVDGVNMILRSNFIPVSMSDGETVSLNLRSLCNKTAKLGVWKVNIVYYDSNKRQLGSVIVNDYDYPGNGVFYVDDATAVHDVQNSVASVTVGEGCITVSGASAVKVYALDGRCVYDGCAATIGVESGAYLVVAESVDGVMVTKKVFVW